jgi:DNA-binding transcriptional LysR family regulator
MDDPIRHRFNLARIDLVSIRLVVLCARYGSLHAAARSGNMSLSSASRRLASLEDSFRVRFFERGYRGLQLTPAGSVFAMHSDELLRTLERLDDQLTSLNSNT